jgi:hypothetical protein
MGNVNRILHNVAPPLPLPECNPNANRSRLEQIASLQTYLSSNQKVPAAQRQ